jgi:hypothetical protein
MMRIQNIGAKMEDDEIGEPLQALMRILAFIPKTLRRH